MVTLTEYDCDQRSEEWFELRRGMVTASAIAQLLTPTLKVANNDTSRGVVASLTAERITGHVEPSWTNADMERGILHEPFARDKYAEKYAPVREIGFMVRDINGHSLGCSPDGLVGDDGMIEIKCPRAKGHLMTIVSGSIPASYLIQCQTALLVSGRKWLDYVSFCAGLPLFVKRVLPDTTYFTAITEALFAFEAASESLASDYFTAAEGLHPTERIPDDLGLVF